jgi:hypothetical protein
MQTVCTIIAGTDPPIGTCSNPSGNDPEGDTCGLTPGARNSCCGCASPKVQCCKPDLNGVDRCYGTPAVGNCPTGYTGQAPCCIATGGACTFSAECCNFEPCLPDPKTGMLTCGATCSDQGQVCTSTADCCGGKNLTCQIPPGSLSGTCELPAVTVDAGVGQPDAGLSCSNSGQKCSTTQSCCAGLNLDCEQASTGNSCQPAETDCTCVTIIP